MVNLTEQPFLTIYQIVEFWEQETHIPRLILLRRIKAGLENRLKFFVTNPFPDEFNSDWFPSEFEITNLRGEWPATSPADYAWSALTILENSQEIDESIFIRNFTRMVISKFGDLPSPRGLGFFAEKSLKELLSAILIHKEDFRFWGLESGFPLPRFWFGENHSPQQKEPQAIEKEKHSPKQEEFQNLETRLQKVVFDAFWAKLPPEGCNRPLKDQIVDWLMAKYGERGLTKTAAVRIFRASRPKGIPQHGNVPHTKKPFPTPPYLSD